MTGAINAGASTTSIGAKFADGTTYYPLDGLVDDVGVYNRALTPAELVAIYQGGTAGQFTQTGGQTTIAGGTLGNSPEGQISLQGGTLAGTGTIAGAVTNAAIVSPGAPGGVLTVAGSYSQTAAGTLDVELVANTAGGYGQLAAQGAVTLDGTLAVSLASGFLPISDSSFPVVTGASVTGQFATTTGLSPGGGVALQAIYDTADVTLLSQAPAAIEISPTGGLITSQAGQTATFTAVLTVQPTDTVAFGLSSSNTSEGTVSTSQLTFTPLNWNLAQTVTITGADDLMDDGDVPYTILVAPAVSNDPAYSGYQPSDVSVTNRGTRHAGFTVAPTSGLVTTSSGGTASFTVALNSRPTAEVNVTLSSSDSHQGTASVTSLAFTPANWNHPQTVTVTGASGGQQTGSIAYSIVFAAATSADLKYKGLTPTSVSLTNSNPLADLQVTGLKVAPATGVQSGEALVVQWSDSNTGLGPVTASFTDKITVVNTTTGVTIGTGVVSYNEGPSGPIAAGSSVAQQFSFTLPAGAPGVGQIQFTVATNAGGTVVEGNPSGTATTNDTASVSVASTIAPYPDLTVTNLAVNAPSGIIAGGSYVLSWRDANAGNAATPAGTSWSDSVVITNTTTNQTIASVSVPYNASPASNGPIAAGGSHAQQYAFQLPGGSAGTGSLRFTVTVNANAAVFEYNAAGTAATNDAATITQTSAFGNYPDLQVASLGVTPSLGLQSGGSVTVSWSDNNAGTADASTSWVDSLVIQNTTTGKTLATVALPYDATSAGKGPLAAGQSTAQQYTYRLPDGDAGTGTIGFTVTTNSTASLFEYNTSGTSTTNDTASTQATSSIAPYPDLQVENVQLQPSSLYSGVSGVLQWQDVNTGNGMTSGSWDDRVIVLNTTTGKTLATYTLVYDSTRQGALAAGAAAQQQYAFMIPTGSAGLGTIQFMVTTNVLGGFYEYNSSGTAQANNTTSISAASGLAPAADLQVANLGLAPASGLQSGSHVVLSWDDANAGNAATTGSWVDSVTVTNKTTGATIFSDTVPYNSAGTGNGPVAAGHSVPQQDAFTIPDGDAGAGTLAITVVVDSARSIPDYTGAGGVDPAGTASITRASALAPYPELSVSNVTAPPLTIGDPASVTIGWTVTNTGTAATAAVAWNDTVFASPDDIPGNGDDILLGTFAHSGALAAGQGYSASETFLLPPAFQGQYHLFVHSDAGNAVFQNGSKPDRYAEAPNLFDVTTAPYSDLVITSLDVPSTAASSQPLTLSWSVKNQGIGVTAPSTWSDSISLATDPQGHNLVYSFPSFGHSGALAPGGSYSRSGEVILPDGISGTYYIVVRTGSPNEFIYTNNNTAVSGPITVALTPAPDLTVTSIQAPSTAESGSTIDVTWTVTNLGPGDAIGLWPDVVSLQEVGGANRTIGLGSFAYSVPLSAGKFYTRTEEFTLPSDIQGVFQAVVATDPETPFGRDLYEVANPVDTTIDPNPLVISLPIHPDLQVASITPASSHVQAGGTLGLQFVVINQGTVATTTPHWTDEVFLSLDSTLSGDDILLSSAGNQSALQPGQTYLTSLSSIPIAKSKSGPYYLIVETNAGGAQDEFPNGNNNTLAVPITIDPLLPSDLVVSNVIVPTQATAGSQITVKYTVTDLGDGPTDVANWTDGVWLTTGRGEPYVTGTLLTTVAETGELTNDPHDPDLPRSYTETLTVTLPIHLSGQLFLTPQTDIYQQVDQTTLASNVNPDAPNDFRSDNFKAAPILVLPEPPPDLVVTAIKVPAAAQSGTVFPVSWSVTDQGNGTTEDSQWYDGIYLSTSPTWSAQSSPQQISLGYFLHTGALSPGQSYSAQQSILLSPAYTGDYIIVYANELDAGLHFGGTWEGPYGNNNTSAVATDVTAAPADLQVTSVVVAPQAYSGESTTVTWTATNFGAPVWSGTQYWNDMVWVSADPTFIAARATYLGSFPHTNSTPLGTNQSYTTTQAVTLPPGIGGKVTPATYYIYVKADPLPPTPPENISPEDPESVQFYQSHAYEGEGANELNNQGSAILPVYYREPDLFVNNVIVPASPPTAGDTIAVTWTVINQGTRDTRTGDWKDGIWLSPFPSLDPLQSTRLGEYQHSGILAMGASYTQTLMVGLPYGISGNYYIVVFTDDSAFYTSMGNIQEFQDEGNNITAVPMQVLPTPLPDLRVTEIDVPQQAVEGQLLPVTYTVTNATSAPPCPARTCGTT